MMFGTAMSFIAQHEWANRPDGALHIDPNDPGGATKYGIAQKFHPTVNVVTLTLPQAYAIYQSEYWNNCNCNHIPSGMDMCVFDAAVQHGVSRALVWYKLYPTDVRAYLQARREFYLALNNPSQIRGWFNRLNDLSKFISINT